MNHVLNMKRGRVEVQHASIDFASYGAALDATPDLELADLNATSAETDLLVTEEMLSCTLGMLLCLDREFATITRSRLGKKTRPFQN